MRYFSIAALLLALLASAGAYAQLAMTGAGKYGAGAPPPTCNGTIDLSTGCVQPMLR